MKAHSHESSYEIEKTIANSQVNAMVILMDCIEIMLDGGKGPYSCLEEMRGIVDSYRKKNCV